MSALEARTEQPLHNMQSRRNLRILKFAAFPRVVLLGVTNRGQARTDVAEGNRLATLLEKQQPIELPQKTDGSCRQ